MRTSRRNLGINTLLDKTTPSIKERRKNAPFFHQCYSDLCKLRNTAPNPLLKAQAGKYILDFCGDRIKIDEWAPILEALKHDRSLHFIAIRSRYPDKKVLGNAETETKARAVTKRPVVLTKFILKLLLESLATCISESTSVTCIELEGLPLTLEYLSILCKGLSSNASLQTISFCNSPIGDEGCKQLCLFLRNMPSVYHLDLSNCDLTLYSALELAETLKYQTLQRYAESWKQSLRYREPDIESMPGLRRIILNNNLHIGDEGVKYLTEVLKEDLWLRALDLQNCGVTNVGAQDVLEMLDMNGTLCIIDLRDNRCIEEVLTHQIMLKLFHNNANKDAHEYNWIIPRSQLSNVPSSQSLRSRQSLSVKHISSLKSTSSVITPSTIQKCKSLYTARRNPSDRKIPFGIDNILQKHHTVTSQSTSAIGQGPKKLLMTSTECVPKIREAKQKLKKDCVENQIKSNISVKNEPHSEKLNVVEIKKENSSIQEQKEKEDFCFVKAEAYEAVFEALGGFSTFMKRIKDANQAFLQEKECIGNGNVEDKVDALHSQRAVSNLLAHETNDDEDDVKNQNIHSRKKPGEESDVEEYPEKLQTSILTTQNLSPCCMKDYESPTSSLIPSPTCDDSCKESDKSPVDQGALTSSLSKIQELYESLVKVSAVRGKDQIEE